MSAYVMEFGHGTLTLGANEFICQIQSATIAGANTRRDISTACGTSSKFILDRADLTITFLQDWTASGISRYLADHFNQDVAFSFSTDPDGTPLAAGNVTCARPSFGGDALAPLVDTLTLPCVGIPTISSDV
jgi:hypothetical protein